MSRIDRLVKINVALPELDDVWSEEEAHAFVTEVQTLRVYNRPLEEKGVGSKNFYVLRDELEELLESDLLALDLVIRELNLNMTANQGITKAALSFVANYGNSGDSSSRHLSAIRETLIGMFKYRLTDTSLDLRGLVAMVEGHEVLYRRGRLFIVDRDTEVEFA